MKWWHFGLLACLVIALLSPLASSAPDGLEKVAEGKGFLVLARQAPFQIIADYLFPGIRNETLASMLAALLGTLTVFGLVCGLAWLVKSRRSQAAKDS